MNPDPLSFSELLDLENSQELLAFQCPRTGIPLWTAIRQQTLRHFGMEALYEAPLEPGQTAVAGSGRKASFLARAARHNLQERPQLRSRGEITIAASGAGLSLQSGKYFNRLSDHFVLAEEPRSVAIEDGFDWIWPQPRANSKVLFRAPIQAAAAIEGRVLERFYVKQAQPFVDFVLDRGERVTGSACSLSTRRGLVSLAARWLATAPGQVDAYRKIYRRLGTRLLIKEEGCYGHAAPMIVAAHDLGIATAEYQHGLVSAGHDAYNFASAIAASDAYRHTLPQYFLSYGRWWQDQINAPLKKVVIGNPHRDHRLRDWRGGERTEILVLGDAIDRAFYRAFCQELAACLPPAYRVCFRPHPIERSHFRDASERHKWIGITIDDRPDIYASFAMAAAVIGESSTALFEAAGLVPQVCVLDTQKSRFAMPHHPFAKITSAGDLQRRLAGGDSQTGPFDGEAIWASGWEQRYRHFIENILA